VGAAGRSVLVVGSVALDTVKTPFGEANEALGGSASFFAVAARHFVPVSLVAVVGEDFPAEHVGFFRERNIDVEGLVTAPGRTFRWSGEYGYDLNTRRTLETQLNVFAGFDPRLSERHRATQYVFLANIHPALQHRVLEQVRDPRLVVMDTMNFWIEGEREALLETIRRVDVLLLNDEETRMLSGEPNLIKAARSVLDLGPSFLVVKKGEHGALLMSRTFAFAAPAYPIEFVFDPTGAGDSFAGGFLGYLASCGEHGAEAEIRRAAIYGTVLASFAVESFSLSRLAAATREEIESRFREIRNLARF
jgi:sugar/nucleoside kinase (ribokinase family)